jgi:hypothetical protein
LRKIAGPGHVSNEFVDYDPVSNPDGTVFTADWGNDVQKELVGIQDEASISEAAGDNKYVLSAIKFLAIKHSKPVGEIFHMNRKVVPAAFDKDSPDSFFPGLCISDIEISVDLTSAHWPLLVPILRALALTYNEGMSGEKSNLDVTDWDVTSSVATLTLANTTAENAILEALSEDNLIHGSFTNWRSVTLDNSVGNIPAGEYAITDIDPLTRTIKFGAAVSDGSGSVTANCVFYTHRIPGSSTSARMFEDHGRAILSAGDGDGDYINGLRRRDQIMNHQHKNYIPSKDTGGMYGNAGTNGNNYWLDPGYATGQSNAIPLSSDPYNGRAGDYTAPRSNVTHRYIWGGNYIA